MYGCTSGNRICVKTKWSKISIHELGSEPIPPPFDSSGTLSQGGNGVLIRYIVTLSLSKGLKPILLKYLFTTFKIIP
ncbi:hypothetical protein D9M69_705580 [compost metagenome]